MATNSADHIGSPWRPTAQIPMASKADSADPAEIERGERGARKAEAKPREGGTTEAGDKQQDAVVDQACRRVVRTEHRVGDHSVVQSVGSAPFSATGRERRSTSACLEGGGTEDIEEPGWGKETRRIQTRGRDKRVPQERQVGGKVGRKEESTPRIQVNQYGCKKQVSFPWKSSDICKGTE